MLREFTIRGVMASPDSKGRMVVLVSNRVAGRADWTWDQIKRRVAGMPPDARVPLRSYREDETAGPDGVIGECWVALPRGARGERVAKLARELSGIEVELTVRAKRYSLVSRTRHNFGETVRGTRLMFVGGLQQVEAGAASGRQ